MPAAAASPPTPPTGPGAGTEFIRPLDLLNNIELNLPVPPDARNFHVNGLDIFIQHSSEGAVSQLSISGDLTPVLSRSFDYVFMPGYPLPQYQVRQWYDPDEQRQIRHLNLAYDPSDPDGLLSRIGPCGEVMLEAQLAPVCPQSNGESVNANISARALQSTVPGNPTTDLTYITHDSGIPWTQAIANLTSYSLNKLGLEANAQAQTQQQLLSLFASVETQLSSVRTDDIYQKTQAAKYLRNATRQQIEEAENPITDKKKRQLILEDVARIPFIERFTQELKKEVNQIEVSSPNAHNIARIPRSTTQETTRKNILGLNLELSDDLQSKLRTSAYLSDYELFALAVEYSGLIDPYHTANSDDNSSSQNFWSDRPASNFPGPTGGKDASVVASDGILNGATDAIFVVKMNPDPFNKGVLCPYLQLRSAKRDQWGWDLVKEGPGEYIVPPNKYLPFGTKDIKVVNGRGREGGLASYTICLQRDGSGGLIPIVDRWIASNAQDIYPDGSRKVYVDAEHVFPSIANETEKSEEDLPQFSVAVHNGAKYKGALTMGTCDVVYKVIKTTTLWRFGGEPNAENIQHDNPLLANTETSLPDWITSIRESQIASEDGVLYAYIIAEGDPDNTGTDSTRMIKIRLDQPQEPPVETPPEPKKDHFQFLPMIKNWAISLLGLDKKDKITTA